jgi:hypothetical protein
MAGVTYFFMINVVPCRFPWPRGLRSRSAAALLWGLWFRIPPGHGCLSLVIVVCCQTEVCATGRSLVQRSSNKFGVTEVDLETSTMRRLRTISGVETQKENTLLFKSHDG